MNILSTTISKYCSSCEALCPEQRIIVQSTSRLCSWLEESSLILSISSITHQGTAADLKSYHNSLAEKDLYWIKRFDSCDAVFSSSEPSQVLHHNITTRCAEKPCLTESEGELNNILRPWIRLLQDQAPACKLARRVWCVQQGIQGFIISVYRQATYACPYRYIVSKMLHGQNHTKGLQLGTPIALFIGL